MNVRLLDEVYDDVSSAVYWYEKRCTGLGEDFSQLFFSLVERLPEQAFHHAIDDTGYRPLRMPRFTAVVYYAIEADEIVVAGVMVGGRSASNLLGRE